QIDGHRSRHLSDRRHRHRPRCVAQGQSAGPCRRSAAGGARPLTNPTRCGTLAREATAILATADPAVKAAASRALAESWGGGVMALGRAVPPPHPARPRRPLLRPPREMPKRRAFGSQAGRIALLHALAPIELKAIDLGLGLVARLWSREMLPGIF